jgi:hypothetical protein
LWALLDALEVVRRLPAGADHRVDLSASLTNVNSRAELRALRSPRSSG